MISMSLPLPWISLGMKGHMDLLCQRGRLCGWMSRRDWGLPKAAACLAWALASVCVVCFIFPLDIFSCNNWIFGRESSCREVLSPTAGVPVILFSYGGGTCSLRRWFGCLCWRPPAYWLRLQQHHRRVLVEAVLGTRPGHPKAACRPADQPPRSFQQPTDTDFLLTKPNITYLGIYHYLNLRYRAKPAV